jgi:hypothetical protein
MRMQIGSSIDGHRLLIADATSPDGSEPAIVSTMQKTGRKAGRAKDGGCQRGITYAVGGVDDGNGSK